MKYTRMTRLALTLTLILTLAGCGGSKQTSSSQAFSAPSSSPRVTITDEEREMTFTFTLEDTADGAVLIDTGDFGQAIIEECDPIDVVNALGQVGSQGESVN